MSTEKIRKVFNYFKRNGIMQTFFAMEENLRSPYYRNYIYKEPEEEEIKRQKETKWEELPTFSIVVPAYETKEEYLEKLILSLQNQTYPYWQLIIADAGSSNKVKNVCDKVKDKRLFYVKLTYNEGISNNTNEAIKIAEGDYTGFLDHDDFLTCDALYEMAKAIVEGKKRGKEYVFLYSDEDKCNETGTKFFDPHIKTKFNFDLLLTNNYICHFLVVNTERLKEVKLRKEYDGAQDFDLVLRLIRKMIKNEERPEEKICHIPKVLYHWRCHSDSTSVNPESKMYAYEAGKNALISFCTEMGWEASVESLPHLGFYRIEYKNGIFNQRRDIGAIGGKEVKKGKIVGSIFDENGTPVFEGLPARFSGYIHRAALTQNADRLDINKWRVNPLLEKELYQVLEKKSQGKELDEKEKQEILCTCLTKHGYRLYWDPKWRVR